MNDPLLDAIGWLHQAIFGRIAMLMAVVAVAAIGARMLAGRIDNRKAIAAIVGCFLISGAVAIGGALTGSQTPELDRASVSAPQQASAESTPYSNADPYAGAAPLPGAVSKDEYRERKQSR